MAEQAHEQNIFTNIVDAVGPGLETYGKLFLGYVESLKQGAGAAYSAAGSAISSSIANFGDAFSPAAMKTPISMEKPSNAKSALKEQERDAIAGQVPAIIPHDIGLQAAMAVKSYMDPTAYDKDFKGRIGNYNEGVTLSDGALVAPSPIAPVGQAVAPAESRGR